MQFSPGLTARLTAFGLASSKETPPTLAEELPVPPKQHHSKYLTEDNLAAMWELRGKGMAIYTIAAKLNIPEMLISCCFRYKLGIAERYSPNHVEMKVYTEYKKGIAHSTLSRIYFNNTYYYTVVLIAKLEEQERSSVPQEASPPLIGNSAVKRMYEKQQAAQEAAAKLAAHKLRIQQLATSLKQGQELLQQLMEELPGLLEG